MIWRRRSYLTRLVNFLSEPKDMNKTIFTLSLIFSATGFAQQNTEIQNQPAEKKEEIVLIRPLSTVTCHELQNPWNLRLEKGEFRPNLLKSRFPNLLKSSFDEEPALQIREVCFLDPKNPGAERQGLEPRLEPKNEDSPLTHWKPMFGVETPDPDFPKIEYSRSFRSLIVEVEGEEPPPLLGQSKNSNYFRMILETASDLEFLEIKLNENQDIFFNSDTGYTHLSFDSAGTMQDFNYGRISSEFTSGIRSKLSPRTTLEVGVSFKEDFKIYQNGNGIEKIYKEDSDETFFVMVTMRL